MIYTFSVPVYVYDVQQRCGDVSVRYVDRDILIIRRGAGTPKEAVSGRADVVVGIDEHGRIVNIEIDFAEYYYIDKEKAREVLRKARW
jgi:uncharacterized protein YuzE